MRTSSPTSWSRRSAATRRTPSSCRSALLTGRATTSSGFMSITSSVHGDHWEDYYRWCTESGVEPVIRHRPESVCRLTALQGRRGAASGNLGGGFFIDNLFYRSLTTQHDCGNHRGQGQGNSNDKKFKFDKECNNPIATRPHDDEGRGHHFQSSSVDYAELSLLRRLAEDDGRLRSRQRRARDVHDRRPGRGPLLPATYSIVLSNGYSWAGSVPAGA